MLGFDLRMAHLLSELLRREHRFLGFLGELIEIHSLFSRGPTPARCPITRPNASHLPAAAGLRSALSAPASVPAAAAHPLSRKDHPSHPVFPPPACRVP